MLDGKSTQMSSANPTVHTARNRLDEIVRQDTSTQQKATDALDLGIEYLGADFGYLAVTDEQFNYWEPIVSTEIPEGVPEHSPRELSTTYCRRTTEDDTQIALHDLPNQGFADDPGYQTFGCHCYLGTPLIVDGTQRGTVCFVSEEPRSRPFDDAELLFAELLARVLGDEFKCDRKEKKIRNQANLTTVLSRILRHNLRNNMTVIRGHAQAMADQLESELRSDLILKNVDKLIKLGDKARTLESVIDQTASREPTDIGALAARVVSTADDETPAASITVDASEGLTTLVRPNFERALKELLDNAVKHGGDSPTVAVEVEQTPTAVAVHVTDDGPGLPRQERDVLENEAETPLVHGSGLGLWIVHWIVTGHGGTVESTVTADGTRMTVSVPQATEPPADSMPTGQDRVPECTRARDQYQAAFEESNDAMVITDDDGRIIDANSTAADLYGATREALLGQSVPELLPDDFDFDATWESFLASGTTRDTMTIVDGDRCERTVEYTGTANIVPGQHLFVSRDITDRVEQQSELRAKARATDDEPTGITIGDTSVSGNPLRHANERFCEQFGSDKFEVLGRNCRFPQDEAINAEALDRIRQSISNREPITETVRDHCEDGTEF